MYVYMCGGLRITFVPAQAPSHKVQGIPPAQECRTAGTKSASVHKVRQDLVCGLVPFLVPATCAWALVLAVSLLAAFGVGCVSVRCVSSGCIVVGFVASWAFLLPDGQGLDRQGPDRHGPYRRIPCLTKSKRVFQQFLFTW